MSAFIKKYKLFSLQCIFLLLIYVERKSSHVIYKFPHIYLGWIYYLGESLKSPRRILGIDMHLRLWIWRVLNWRLLGFLVQGKWICRFQRHLFFVYANSSIESIWHSFKKELKVLVVIFIYVRFPKRLLIWVIWPMYYSFFFMCIVILFAIVRLWGLLIPCRSPSNRRNQVWFYNRQGNYQGFIVA